MVKRKSRRSPENLTMVPHSFPARNKAAFVALFVYFFARNFHLPILFV